MPRNRSFSDGDDNGQRLSLGSGFCLGDGKLASNIHVIAGATSGYAKLVGENTKYDIEGIAALRLWPRSQGNVEISRGPLSDLAHSYTPDRTGRSLSPTVSRSAASGVAVDRRTRTKGRQASVLAYRFRFKRKYARTNKRT